MIVIVQDLNLQYPLWMRRINLKDGLYAGYKSAIEYEGLILIFVTYTSDNQI